MASPSTTIRYNGQPGTSDAALYTSSGVTTLSQVVAYNGTGTGRTLTLFVQRANGNIEYLTGGAGPLADPPAGVPTTTIVPAGHAVTLFDRRLATYNEIVLGNGDALHGSASAATAVNVLAF